MTTALINLLSNSTPFILLLPFSLKLLEVGEVEREEE